MQPTMPVDRTAAGTRRLARRTDRRVVAGVAAGLAEHLGLDVRAVRVAFVVLTLAGGAGILFYFGLLAVTPAAGSDGAATGGRTGTGELVAFAALGAGVLLLVGALGVTASDPVVWPTVLGGLGVALVWRQADDDRRSRWLGSAGRLPARARLRVVAGVALVTAGGVAFLAASDRLGQARQGLLATVVVVAGLAMFAGPCWVRMAADLGDERRARIRSEERAELAAHLHDSVLQTLALIQRHGRRPARWSALARAPGARAARRWLYGRAPGDADEQLRRGRSTPAAAEVEDDHGVRGRGGGGRRRAARRRGPGRWSPAARGGDGQRGPHAGVDRVVVFVEVDDGEVAVFVRDRGCGFDPAAVAPDRPASPSRSSAASTARRAAPRPSQRARRRHRGRAAHAAPRGGVVTGRPAAGRPGRRPRPVPRRRAGRARRRASRWSARPATSTSAVAVIRRAAPDVVLLDVHMPGGGGPRSSPALRRRAARRALPRPVGVRRRRGRHRRRSGPAPAATSPRPSPAPSWPTAIERVADGDAVFSPRLAGFVLDAFAGSDVAGARRPRARPAHAPRAGGAAPHRPRLRVQGGRPPAAPVGEDGRDPRVGRAAQAPAVQPPRADPLGHRPPADLTGCAERTSSPGLHRTGLRPGPPDADEEPVTVTPLRRELPGAVHVGRQPVFDRDLAVTGYLLSFRDALGGEAAVSADADQADVHGHRPDVRRLRARGDLRAGPGLGDLDPGFLTRELPLPFGTERTVLVVPDGIEVDEQVVAGLEELAPRGTRSPWQRRGAAPIARLLRLAPDRRPRRGRPGRRPAGCGVRLVPGARGPRPRRPGGGRRPAQLGHQGRGRRDVRPGAVRAADRERSFAAAQPADLPGAARDPVAARTPRPTTSSGSSRSTRR